MQVKKIFLASSEELKDDRQAFELMLGRLNALWRPRDFIFEAVVWEDFIDAMSKEGLQKEYNKAVEQCDIFVMLFFTKVGPYTLEEFETAFAEMSAGTRPHIYTFFKNDLVLTGDLNDNVRSLLDFKARLRTLKHYPTSYRNAEDLKFQFSQQLDKLYGGDGTSSAEITDSTPQSKIGEIALVLCHRQLFDDSIVGVDLARLKASVPRASRQVRTAIFNMAVAVRSENWIRDKYRMERTLPIFEALTGADPNWHGPYGQLGYVLKEKLPPDWKRALENLSRAVELRGDDLREGTFYHWCRAECLIHLDPNFLKKIPADAETKALVLEALRQARREVELRYNWGQILENPESENVRTWLRQNGSPRLR